MNRLFLLAKNIIKSNFLDLQYPYRLTYILTYKCQLKCSMCNIWQKSTENELSLEEIETFFNKSNRFSWINLSGGEIFLRKDLSEVFKIIFKYCKNLYLLDFPTNGYQTEETVDTVKKIITSYKIPKLVVTVSLDGPSELHDKIRNMPGSWNKAVETFSKLRRLRTSRFNVFFGMTLQPLNIGRFHETFESIDKKIGKIRYDDFHINLIQYSRHYYGNIGTDQSVDSQNLWAELKSISKLYKTFLFNPIGFLEKRYHKLAKIYSYTKKTPISCQALSASFFMDPMGNVYPCSINDKIIGNIRNYDYNIYKLWCTTSRYKLREEIRRKNCPRCWTPCEAYQSILANLIPKFQRGRA